MSELATVKANLLAAMKQHNVDTITIEYSGCGDSGGIDDVAIKPTEAAKAEVAIAGFTDYDFSARATKPRIATSFNDAAELLAYLLIEQYHSGYENNDGGAGVITVSQDAIEYERTDYYTESSTDSLAL
jgi:hypothetical protein